MVCIHCRFGRITWCGKCKTQPLLQQIPHTKKLFFSPTCLKQNKDNKHTTYVNNDSDNIKFPPMDWEPEHGSSKPTYC